MTKESKMPDSVKIDFKCPHCSEAVFVLLTKRQIQQFRRGMRMKIRKAAKLWGTMTFRVGKGAIDRKKGLDIPTTQEKQK